MESGMTASLRRCAVEWHVRLRHGDDVTWEAFADWLAENPLHAQAYDEVEQNDLALDPLLPEIQFRAAANDLDDDEGERPVAPAERRSFVLRWGLGGGALAASIAAAVMLAPQFMSDRYDVVTRPGEQRVIALDAATKVILNGSTRMTFDRKDARFAALDKGEALFHVRHDAAHPFRLQVGDSRIEDVGTVFNVVRDAGEVRVSVGEGAVLYRVDRTTTPLAVGEILIDRAGTTLVAPTPATSVGGWEGGRLTYSGQPLSQVASDLARSLGIAIAVAPELADRPFSGTIILDRAGSDAERRRRLAAALDVSLEAGSHGWTMKSRDGAGQ